MEQDTPPSGEVEVREKYSQKDRDEMAKSGAALPDGSYPIKDREDVENAIKTAGLGNASDSSIRKHIIARAKAVGASDLIPDTWNEDGSKEEQKVSAPQRRHRRKERHRAVPLLPEVRHFSATGLEVRSSSDSEIVIRGSAIVYNEPYVVRDLVGEFEERMHAGCVSSVLARGVDCRLLLNHDGLAMARTTAGTLTLIDTPRSLDLEARLDPRQSLARDFAIAIERRDMTQMSVGMIVNDDTWGTRGTTETRDVYGLADLLDVSGVTYPCSPTTNIEVAQRMVMQMPVESRAQLRRLSVSLNGLDLRVGKVLSAENQGKVETALKALHSLASAAEMDPQALLDEQGENDAENSEIEDGTIVGDIDNGEGPSAVAADGTGVRQIDPGEKMRDDESPAETRDDPTPEDWGVSSGLKSLKMEIAGVKARQLADPDNGTDPDDEAVMAAINEAEAAIDKAIVAQSKDGRPDAGPATERMKASTLRLMVEAGRSQAG